LIELARSSLGINEKWQLIGGTDQKAFAFLPLDYCSRNNHTPVEIWENPVKLSSTSRESVVVSGAFDAIGVKLVSISIEPIRAKDFGYQSRR
jgi:hypothetical protein